MKVLLIDFDGKIPNVALMKYSTYYKNMGADVYLNTAPCKVDKVICSVLFTWNRNKAKKLKQVYNDIEFGGTGWDPLVKLHKEVEECVPDYDLYKIKDLYNRIGGIMKKETRLIKAKTLVNMGIGFTSRGCVRNCGFCIVPKKEGCFKQVGEIKDLINPRSNVVTLLDNNFTADPYMIQKCEEIKERNLEVDISQGIDIRLITEEKAQALAKIKHHRSIHYAWDLMKYEKQVIRGIQILSKYIKKYKQMCFMLVGYNTSFAEDMYRFQKLLEMEIDPYIMIYNKKHDEKLKHFARWVNARIYKKCSFSEYEPWIREQTKKKLA